MSTKKYQVGGAVTKKTTKKVVVPIKKKSKETPVKSLEKKKEVKFPGIGRPLSRDEFLNMPQTQQTEAKSGKSIKKAQTGIKAVKKSVNPATKTVKKSSINMALPGMGFDKVLKSTTDSISAKKGAKLKKK